MMKKQYALSRNWKVWYLPGLANQCCQVTSLSQAHQLLLRCAVLCSQLGCSTGQLLNRTFTYITNVRWLTGTESHPESGNAWVLDVVAYCVTAFLSDRLSRLPVYSEHPPDHTLFPEASLKECLLGVNCPPPYWFLAAMSIFSCLYPFLLFCFFFCRFTL